MTGGTVYKSTCRGRRSVAALQGELTPGSAPSPTAMQRRMSSTPPSPSNTRQTTRPSSASTDASSRASSALARAACSASSQRLTR
eukprot:6667964-Prymnesium_polylepis.1